MSGFKLMTARRARLSVVIVAVLCVLDSQVSAEVPRVTPMVAGDRSMSALQHTEALRQPPPRIGRSIRDSLDAIDYGRIAVEDVRHSAVQGSSSGRKSSVGRKLLGGAIGATAGFFAGGYHGAAIDGDCGGCDDPGFKGALIGAPIGAVTGGILGALIF